MRPRLEAQKNRLGGAVFFPAVGGRWGHDVTFDVSHYSDAYSAAQWPRETLSVTQIRYTTHQSPLIKTSATAKLVEVESSKLAES